MDQSPLVDEQVADGRRLVERFAADGNPVRAAFWVKTAEDGLWFLYVVTDLVDAAGPSATYRAVRAALQQLGPSEVSGSEVKVIGPANQIARDVAAVVARHPGRLATRFGGGVLGSVAAEQVYVYPPHFFTFGQVNPMTREDIGREIIRLMNRGAGILLPSRVTLRDGTAFDGVPFGLQLGRQNVVVAQFVVDREAAPRTVELDEIASIA